MQTCGRCGDEVVWYRTVNGRPMPLSMGTHENGNIVIENGLVVVLKRDDPRLTDPTVPKHISHFATCRKNGR